MANWSLSYRAHISAAIVDPRSTLDIKPSTYKPILYLVKPPAPVGLGFPISKPSVLSLDQAEDGGFPKDDRHSNCTIPGSPLHSHFKVIFFFFFVSSMSLLFEHDNYVLEF